ncbi:MAG: threonine/serine exporter family protein [Anaeromyxobacter sp.]
MSTLADLLAQAALAAIPAAGFGMLFNVPFRMLGWCALLGAVGRGLRFLMVTSGLPLPWSTLMAAGAVSFLGVWAAQRLRAHPKVVTVAAVIPMVPGTALYTALLATWAIERGGLTPELASTAVRAGLDATFVVAALAVGLAAPGLFVYRRRPVV